LFTAEDVKLYRAVVIFAFVLHMFPVDRVELSISHLVGVTLRIVAYPFVWSIFIDDEAVSQAFLNVSVVHIKSTSPHSLTNFTVEPIASQSGIIQSLAELSLDG